jgi:hypothetical protein
MKALDRYSQGLASDEYQNAWSRNQAETTGRFNRLASLAGVGQTAANSLGNFNANYGNNLASLYADMGNSQAAGINAQRNFLFNALGGAANIATMGATGGFGGFGGGGIPTQGMSGAGSLTGPYGNGWSR